MKKSRDWTGLYQKNPQLAVAKLHACISAEAMLIGAVNATDIDWCINRLRQVKTDGPNAKTILETIWAPDRKKTK